MEERDFYSNFYLKNESKIIIDFNPSLAGISK